MLPILIILLLYYSYCTIFCSHLNEIDLFSLQDVLERNLITNTVMWDLRDDKNKKGNALPKGLHLKALVKAINDVGISFTVWDKSDGKGKKTSNYDWRSLTGKEKKLLLNRLPEKFNEVLHPDTCETVKQIWQVNIKYRFCILYFEIPKVYFICCDKMGLCQY